MNRLRVIGSDADRPVEVTIMIKGGHRCELSYRQSIPE